MEKVHIELKRVQTWLFSIPRLRAMAGANALMAEVLREKLPALVAARGRGWELAPPSSASKFPRASAKDPWEQEVPAEGVTSGQARIVDDPRRAAEVGILSQDGGHFEVQLSSGGDALVRAATELLQRELPGLRFQITRGKQRAPASNTLLSAELPVLAPCAWSGHGLASAVAKQGDDREGASLEACRRQEAARRAEQGRVLEPASFLLRQASIGAPAETFQELAAGRYLAVIHADGNGVGGAFPSEASGKNDGSEAARATYHHENRVLLRRALLVALHGCKDAAGPPNVAPALPLMLGGDDLLVVCRATVAMRFVVELCRELERLQRVEPRKQHRLSLGVGVTIAPFTLPFHQLHQVAEALAGSAKRRVRGLDQQRTYSVVDWAVYTSAWAEKDFQATRRRDWLRGAQGASRLLSLRPLAVLPRAQDPCSLEGLLASAEKLQDAPRSQLLYLVEQLGRGRELGELAWRELTPRAKTCLADAGIAAPWETPAPTSAGEQSGPQKARAARRSSSPEAQPSSAVAFTKLHDLVELLEIPRLGSRAEQGAAVHDAAEED